MHIYGQCFFCVAAFKCSSHTLTEVMGKEAYGVFSQLFAGIHRCLIHCSKISNINIYMKQSSGAKKSSETLKYVLITVGILIGVMLIEHTMGRILYCKCGYIKFWEGNNNSSENSQHIADWYTFSHIIHGFLFFWLLKRFLKKTPLRKLFIFALLIEAGWEMLENSSFIIDRYRAATISLDYFGDSILNSICDILSMVVGFWMAYKMPTWVTVILIILMEVIVGYLIRDNLTLNVIMLVYPFEVIKKWQMGG